MTRAFYKAGFSLIGTALAVATPLTAVHAQQAETSAPGDGHHAAHDSYSDPSNEIVVTGHPPVDFGILAATTSIEGDTLVAQTRGQIGDILAGLPGVSATSFAPGASRPVLRGFSGDRVAVLTDGIGSIDASNVSVDHAVVFDALSVDHIDVFHGPAVLLFGGNAIGGAVNALDKRIPRRVPDRLTATAIAGYGSAADERSAGASLDVPLAPRLVAHVDGNWRKSSDLRVGGYVHSAALRSDLLAEAAELREEGEPDEAQEFEDLAALSGRVPNTAARSYTLGAGVAFIDTGGDLGVSVQRFDTRYGVPIRPGTGHHHGPETNATDPVGDALESGHASEAVKIDLVQTRFDVRGGLNLEGFLDSVQFRGAYGDYEHVELEGDEIGTRFSGEGLEFRLDLVQADRNGWRGRSGVHFSDRSLALVGAEAFVPDNTVERLGFFTLQSLEVGGGLTLEAAGRYERSTVKSAEVSYSRGFNLWSGALGLSWDLGSHWKIGANYIHGARAPSAEELLPNGLHVATQAFEIGNGDFAVEKSDGVEAYVKYSGHSATLSLTGFVTDFDNFITALPTDEEEEGFPVFRYVQLPARYFGFEAAGSLEALSWDDGSLTLDAGADYTHAKLKGIGPVPRIPPLRLRGGARYRQGALRIGADVEWNDRQDRVAAFAEPVPAFAIVNASIDWHPYGEDGPLTLMLSAENILDAVGRRAASFTRDFVPLPGRDVRLTGKVTF